MIEDRMFYQSLLERERSWLLRTDVHVLYLRKKATMLSVVVFLCIVAILRTDSWERILPILIGLRAAYAAVMRYRMLAYILRSTRETTDAQIEALNSSWEVGNLLKIHAKSRLFSKCGHLEYLFRRDLILGYMTIVGILLIFAKTPAEDALKIIGFALFAVGGLSNIGLPSLIRRLFIETAETTNAFVESKREAI